MADKSKIEWTDASGTNFLCLVPVTAKPEDIDGDS